MSDERVFREGDDPQLFTVAQVNKYLGGELHDLERERVLNSERDGRNRIGIMSGSGVEDEAPADAEVPVAPPEDSLPASVVERGDQGEEDAKRESARVDGDMETRTSQSPAEALRTAMNRVENRKRHRTAAGA
jgi:hypothetical protein